MVLSLVCRLQPVVKVSEYVVWFNIIVKVKFLMERLQLAEDPDTNFSYLNNPEFFLLFLKVVLELVEMDAKLVVDKVNEAWLAILKGVYHIPTIF